MDAATSATVTGASKCLVEPSGRRMSGMANSKGKKSADEPHFSWKQATTPGVRTRYSVNGSPGAFAVS